MAITVDTVGPAAPTISPTSGEYCVGEPIIVTTDELGPESCTTDGSVPDCASPAAPATITVDMTLRCIECDACLNLGAEASEVYTVDIVADLGITFPVSGNSIPPGILTVTGTADGDIPFVTVTSDQGHGPLTGVGALWSVGLTNVLVPSITITAQGTDACGNFDSDLVTVPVTIVPPTADAIVISGPTQAICATDIDITLTALGVGVPGEAANISCSIEEITTVSYDCVISQVARTSGGTITESGCGTPSPPGEDLTMAFDDDPINTKWLDFCGDDGTTWIYYQYGGGTQYKIKRYEITSGDDAPDRDPMDWELQGSNDGVIWDTLDTRLGIQFVGRNETQAFDIADANVALYEYYRLWITDIWDPAVAVAMQLSEIELYECAEIGGSSYTPLPPPVDVGFGDYVTNASVTSTGPVSIVCAYTGVGGPLTDAHAITFVAPAVVANVAPMPGEVLGPADDLDGNPANGLQFNVTGTTDAPDGSIAAIIIDGVTEATPTVSGGSFTASVTMAAGAHTLVEKVTASCGSASVTKTVTVDLTLYAVIVGDPSSVRIDTITVGTGANFNIMVYGAVLVGGVVSPTSLGSYDFSIKHQVVGTPTLTLNTINGSGTGNEFDHIDGQEIPIDNNDSGDGNAANWFWAMNDGTTFGAGPLGIDIPLAVLNFTAGGVAGTTTIFISGVNDYQSYDFGPPLDTTPLRTLTVIVQ